MPEHRIERMREGEAAACEAVLRALPDWFGLEDAIVQYRKDIETMETHVVRGDDEIVGFLTLRSHGEYSSEIHVMGIRTEHHRKGIGRRLVDHAERLLRDRSVEYLQVKTLGPSRPNESYDRTREFYQAMGFRPLEEFPEMWPGNPCLLMVKKL